MADSAAPPSWDELTAEQRCILFEGLFGHTLIDVLNAWVPDEDAPYWNRKGAHVAPLTRAARALVEMGLIDIWQETLPLGDGEGELMLSGPAAEAVSNPENWWRYDPDDNWDPDEDLTQYTGLADTTGGPMTTLYSVITTQTARDLGLARYPWRLSPPRADCGEPPLLDCTAAWPAGKSQGRHE